MMKIMKVILIKVTLMLKRGWRYPGTTWQARLSSCCDMCPIWRAKMIIMLVMLVTKMYTVLMTRYNLAGWTQLLKCASPIFHPQHQVINVLECGIVFSLKFAIGCLLFGSVYDEVSDQMHNWVAQRSDFKSALRVVKTVLNTQCYQYLLLTMWFHAKKLKETLQKPK